MKHGLFVILFILFFSPLYADYLVTGGSGTPLLAEDNRNNHLQIYLLDGMTDARITYTSSADPATHQWYKYNQSASEAIDVPCVISGNSSYITDIEDGYGYFVGSPTVPSTEYIWIIDYSRYFPKFHQISYMEEEDVCDFLRIVADVDAENLSYMTPRGAPMNLYRSYQLTYKTLRWDESQRVFIPEDIVISRNGIISEIVIDAPLMNTDFTLKGDSFAEHFGKGFTMRTPVYEAVAVEAHGFAETDKETSSNELKNEGVSAPVDYTFSAYANEPVAAFYIWKVTYIREGREPEMKIRYTDKILRYTFTEEGRYEIGLEVIDSKSICVKDEIILTLDIGKTSIQIPNFFSPGTSIGSNDELKIAYTSLISFEASVYNRQGNLLYQWTDPTKGWDGRVSGKFVPTGAYVVIVEYTDTAGKKRTTSRTVNILRANN